VKADTKADSQSDKDSAGKSRSRNKKTGKKQAVNENARTGNEKAAATRDAKYPDEKRPPEWKGNSFRDSDHIPAFLR